MEKNLIHPPKLLILLLVISFVYFCSDGITDVDDEIYGLTGSVLDTLGNTISGVEIFCLYYSNIIPEPVEKSLNIKVLNKSSYFDFELFQNFPNPFSSSTFIRYSLPQKCQIALKLNRKNSKEYIYSYNTELPNGYYQQFFNSIVDSLQMANGIYVCEFEAIGEDETKYNATKEIFVISDRGRANAKTNETGQFIFNFEDVFSGDSVTVNLYDSEYYMYTRHLTNKVNLLFKKKGYQSKIVTFELYSRLLLTQDVVLYKGE